MNNPQIYLLLGASLYCIGLYGILTRENRLGFLVSMMYMVMGLETDLIILSLFGIIPARGLIIGIIVLFLFFIQLSGVFGLIFYFRNRDTRSERVAE